MNHLGVRKGDLKNTDPRTEAGDDGAGNTAAALDPLLLKIGTDLDPA
jgi:hypothetical protein